MLSVGFLCKPVLVSGEIIPPTPPQDVSHRRQLNTDESLSILRAMILQEDSTYTLLLEMSEPPLVAGESHQWIRWFDGIKVSGALIVEGMMS